MNIFCFFITLSFDVMQLVINVLYSFWSVLGVQTPDVRSSLGSLFGCNV